MSADRPEGATFDGGGGGGGGEDPGGGRSQYGPIENGKWSTAPWQGLSKGELYSS